MIQAYFTYKILKYKKTKKPPVVDQLSCFLENRSNIFAGTQILK